MAQVSFDHLFTPFESHLNGLTVRTLRKDDFSALRINLHDPDGWSGRVWGMDTPEKIEGMLDAHLDAKTRNICHPFVAVFDDEPVAISRYHNFGLNGRALEIGGTCIAPKWRKTFVNTTMKYLLLENAFEKQDVVRVEFRVDKKNYTSQKSVLRIGAHFDGIVRNWQIRKNGEFAIGHLYTIISQEWPAIRNNFDLMLKEKRTNSISNDKLSP